LGPTPVSIDYRNPRPRSCAVLLELEIAGRLERHGGGLVSLV
jgi:hypothetical protein